MAGHPGIGLERREQVEPGRRPVNHGEGHRPVEGHHRVRGDHLERLVQDKDLAPVRVLGARSLVMDGRNRGLDLFAGLRYVDVDLTVQVDPTNPLFATATFVTDENFSDLMIGARYTWAFSERWGLTLRGDGSFGDTEGTWSASAIAQYRTRNGGWLFGYRHLDVEVKTGGTTTEITMSGPAIGYGFSF